MIHENLEGKCFGTIDFTIPINEDLFGVTGIGQIGKCELHVYGNEGTKPHFHLICKEAKFVSCIRLDCNCYFPHGNYRGTLNSRQRKELNKYLDTPFNKDETKTVWEAMVLYWNSCKEEDKFKIHIKTKPDYSTMTNFKED